MEWLDIGSAQEIYQIACCVVILQTIAVKNDKFYTIDKWWMNHTQTHTHTHSLTHQNDSSKVESSSTQTAKSKRNGYAKRISNIYSK